MPRHPIFNTRLLALWLGIGLSLGQLALGQSAVPPTDRLILIGDAGRLLNGRNPVVDAVKARYAFDDPRTTLLYLGDNVYPHGLPDESDPTYESSTEILRYQAELGLGGRSRVLFIPGNHDWDKGQAEGWARIKRQGRWLDSLHASNSRLLPANGCPGPEEIHLSDQLVLVLLDTQWWLHPHQKPGPSGQAANAVESDCACQNEAAVVLAVADIARRNASKVLIVATHHPFRSNGIHGGYYTAKQHLFPLTDLVPSLYLPLPVLGSIYPLVRGVFGTVQDLPHPRYQSMVNALETAVAPAPNVVFVAGHDHALQHLIDGSRHYLGSGSGINRERVRKGPPFVSGDWGYVVLDAWANGTVTTDFFTVDEAAHATLAHSDTLFTRLPPPVDSLRVTPPRPDWPDSVRVAIAPEYDRAGRFQRTMLGENYRTLWATPVSFPVFDLKKTGGGFKILQRGGGQQTKSLRLEDSTGREWVLRTVQKDPSQTLPAYLRETLARDVIQDEISAAHPYAPLVVGPLAEALGVPHASPRLVYVPDDPALGIFQAEFGKMVALLEERSPGAGKSVSTANVLEALENDHDHRIDQRAVLRARLLDLLLGDWDRHEDQWRWGSRKTGGGKEYFPIPRDRDQVFFKADGVLPTVAALPWLFPKFQGFDTKLTNVNGFMFNARHFDRLFLQNLDEKAWRVELAEVEKTLTDSLLQRAVGRLPEPIHQRSGAQILATLRARRGWLTEKALTYYRFLAKTVDIPGSDKPDLFQLEHLAGKRLTVSVFKLSKDGSVGALRYQRTFEAAHTREIRVYGQKGKDRFVVSGAEPSGIRLRLIGGKGDDVFAVEGRPGKPLVYDLSTEDNELPDRNLVLDRTSTDPAVNQFDPHAFKHDRLVPLLTAGYNLDDGVLIGAGVEWKKQGFRKTPYASMNRLTLSHALATEATALRYEGIFTRVLGKNDLWINASVKAPNNVANFFGPGNESAYDTDRRIRYYRTRYTLINLSVALKRDLGEHLKVSLGPVFQHFNLGSENNEGRFIERYLAELPDGEPFLRRESYGGVQGNLVLDTRNNAQQPVRGVYWNSTLLGLQGFGERSNHHTQVRSELSVYASFSTAARLVLVNRFGGALTYGRPAFYQLAYLGGHDNLRGFRAYRFAGQHLAYHNLELRLKLAQYRSYLVPGSVGLLFFNDLGRVWSRGEASARWHDGYGGGVYLAPAELLVLTASVAFSDEGTLPYVSVGFRF